MLFNWLLNKSSDPLAISAGDGLLIFRYQDARIALRPIDTDFFTFGELFLRDAYHLNSQIGPLGDVIDIGANIGLHSILMSKCGWTIRAFEPDPTHAAWLLRNLALNRVSTVELVEAAVSDKAGTMEFVRVLGNTMSSHLAGSKPNPYGDLVRFPVKVVPFTDLLPGVDFVKMDAEGQEKTMILTTTAAHWQNLDMMVEVGSAPAAEAIHAHLQKIGVNAFAQRLGWAPVQSLADMPTSYKDGSLFISRRTAMPWNS